MNIKDIVNEYKSFLEGEGVVVDISNCNFQELEKAIKDEKKCGQTGTDLDIVLDLDSTIGIDEFGIMLD